MDITYYFATMYINFIFWNFGIQNDECKKRNICKLVDRLRKNMSCSAHKIVTHAVFFCKLSRHRKMQIYFSANSSAELYNRISESKVAAA